MASLLDQVKACEFRSWYAMFRRYTEPSVIIPLDEDAVRFFRSDGLFALDEDDPVYDAPTARVDSDADDDFGESTDAPSTGQGSVGKDTTDINDKVKDKDKDKDKDDNDDDGDDDGSSSSSESSTPHEPAVPLSRLRPLREAIAAGIEELGGAVFPKLNWTAPVDAVHMIASGGSARCTDPGQVLTLVGASDYAEHDLGDAWTDVSPVVDDDEIDAEKDGGDADDADGDAAPSDRVETLERTLVLRRWNDMPRAGEFRCFVRAGVPIAVCQRHHDTFFASVAESPGTAIAERVARFARNAVCGVFPLDDFVLDVYLTERDSVKIVDFGPWVLETDPLMFTWGELASEEWLSRARDGREPPVWRHVTSQGNVRPSRTVYNAFPIEAMVQDADALVDMLRELGR